MKINFLSVPQSISIMFLFITGSSFIFGVNTRAGQDAWLSVIIAIFFALPLCLIFARLMQLYPESDFFMITQNACGKGLGKFIAIFMIWYALHLAALVLCNFAEFIAVVSMPETPKLPMKIIFLAVSFYIARSDIEVLGKWSVAAFYLLNIFVLITVILSLSAFDLSNFRPFFNQSASIIITGAYETFSFPLAETVLMLGLASSIKKSDNPYKIYISSLFMGGFLLLVIVLRNILVMGSDMIEISNFPSFTAAKLIHIGTVFQRIEGTIALNFILGGITKITVCLLFACKGFAYLFNIEDYKNLNVPTALLVLTLCSISFNNITEMFALINIYSVYAFPFQVIIPLFIWIIAEIKNIKNKRTPSLDTEY